MSQETTLEAAGRDEVLVKAGGGMLPSLSELWAYRELAFFLVLREVRAGHRQMALGPLWIVIGPVVSLLAYTLIFGVVADMPSDGLPYALFNFAALLPWTFFAVGTKSAAESLREHGATIGKVYFPRLILPLVGVACALVDFAASLLVFFVLMAYYGVVPGAAVVWLPLLLLLAGACSLAVGLWLAPWVARYRDTSNVLAYLIAGWMFASPVVYATSVIPEAWLPVYRLNPMCIVVEGFRWGLLGTAPPPAESVALNVALVVLLLVGGAVHFRRGERSIVDVV